MLALAFVVSVVHLSSAPHASAKRFGRASSEFTALISISPPRNSALFCNDTTRATRSAVVTSMFPFNCYCFSGFAASDKIRIFETRPLLLPLYMCSKQNAGTKHSRRRRARHASGPFTSRARECDNVSSTISGHGGRERKKTSTESLVLLRLSSSKVAMRSRDARLLSLHQSRPGSKLSLPRRCDRRTSPSS